MNRALYSPSSFQTHFEVGVLVMLETHRRINGNAFGPTPKALSDDSFNMAGYCIDAHDVMPAGSMEYERFGPEEDDWVWVPTICTRESAAALAQEED
jgi:hypothetical protein